MSNLPSVETQNALIGALAELVRSRGAAPFLRAPLLEPNDRWFPDQWVPTAEGVATLARRLLGFAGLDRLKVEVVVFANEAELEGVVGQSGLPEGGHKGAAAWFAGIRDGCCIFGVDEEKLEDPIGVVAAMAHEVGHAFREFHGIVDDDHELEERLTDVTTVYLGFGILTANAAYRYRASGDYSYTQWSHERLGYLSEVDLAFLLAVHVTSRHLGRRECGRVGGLLEPNQAGVFRAACKLLARRRDDLAERLGVPREPPTSGTNDLPALTPLRTPVAEGENPSLTAEKGWNKGQEVFRVRRTLATVRAFWYGVIGVCVGFALWQFGVGSGMATALLAATGLLSGFAHGRRIRRDICSDPGCGASLGQSDVSCPRCAGAVAGEIASIAARLEAEDERDDDGDGEDDGEDDGEGRDEGGVANRDGVK